VQGHSVYIYLSVNCIFCYVCFPQANLASAFWLAKHWSIFICNRKV